MAAWQRWIPLSGILFVILFIIGVSITTGGYDSTDSDQEILDWYADSGNRVGVVIGAYVLALAAVAFLLFINRLRAVIAEAEDGRTILAPFVLACGTVYALAVCIAGASFAAIAGEIEFGDAPELTDAQLARFLPSLGFGMLLVLGMFPLIFGLLTTGYASIRYKIFPGWFNWLTLVCAIILVFSAVFLPLIALGVWLIVASILLMQRQPGTATAPA